MFRLISFSVIYHLDDFDDLIQSGFWVIIQITFANLCKPVCDFIIIPVSSDPLNLKNVERKKNFKKIEYLENNNSLLDEIKAF